MQLVGALIPNNELPLQYGYIPPGMFLFWCAFLLYRLAVRHKGALRPFQEHWLNSTAEENELQKNSGNDIFILNSPIRHYLRQCLDRFY